MSVQQRGDQKTEEPTRYDLFVIDSDAQTREELKLIAKAYGYSVRGFPDGLPALDAIQEREPRLVVVELLLPGMDGFELCQRIRIDLGLETLPILCVSSISWGAIDLPLLLIRRFGARFLPKGSLTNDFVAVMQELIGASLGRSLENSSISNPPITFDRQRFGVEDQRRIQELIREFEQSLVCAQTGRMRRNVRVQREYRVQFRNAKEFVNEYTHNISAGGLFIRSIDPPPVDEIIDVKIEIPQLGHTLDIRARVVHIVSPTQAAGSALPAGFGVEFEVLPKDVRKVLDKLIDELRLSQTCQPMDAIAPLELESEIWVVLVGLPVEPLLKQPTYLKRNHIHLVDFPDLSAAEEFFENHGVGMLVLAESSLGTCPEETLLRISKSTGALTTRIIIQNTLQNLSELVAQRLCDTILPPTVTMTNILEEICQRLGVRCRETPRIAHRTAVQVTLPGEKLSAEMLNISYGGLLLRSPTRLSIGTSVRLHFDLPESRDVVCRAVVIRCTQEADDTSFHLAGVAFYALSEEIEIQLRRFVQANTNFREFFGWMKEQRFGRQ